jgi:hypothetical protein
MVTMANAQSQWIASVGHKFILQEKQEGVIETDPKSFASIGNENYIAVGRRIDKLNKLPIGIQTDIEYINVDKSYTLAFAAKILFAQQLFNHRGFITLGGAFGYGVDMKDSSSFIDNKTGTQYIIENNPRFIYSRVDIGLVYDFTEHFSILLGFESACRAYDLKLKSQNNGLSNALNLLNVYEAESRSVDLIIHVATLSLSYRF